MAVQVLVAVFTGTGNDDHLRSEVFQNLGCRIGGTSAAQNQNLLPRNLQTAALYQGGKTEIIRIMPEKTAVRSAEDGVDGPHPLGYGREFVQIGDDFFLVGNSDIDAGEISVPEERLQFLRLFFKELVTVAAHMGVDLRRIAVAQFPTQKTALHQTTSL